MSKTLAAATFRLRPARLSLAALLTAIMAAGCNVPAANGPADTFGIDFSMPADVPVNGAVIFIVDGINSPIFQRAMEAGELPALKKYFVDRGLYVPTAVTSNSSLTMDNLTSLVTGRFPGHHGLVGAKWFDRNTLFFRNHETLAHKNTLDDDYRCPTIYELFPDRLTFSLFLQPHRGATKFFEDRMSAGPAIAFSMYPLVDRTTLHRFAEVASLAREAKEFPAVTTVYLLSVNFAAYAGGVVGAKPYHEALVDTDRQIGRVLGDMARAGVLDKLLIALVSDHGHCDTPKHPHIEDDLRAAGLDLVSAVPSAVNSDFADRLKFYEKYPAVTYGAGDRYWSLYLRKPIYKDGKPAGLESWLHRPDPDDLHHYPTRDGGQIDLLAELIRQESIDALSYRSGPNSVRVLLRAGEVEFTRSWHGPFSPAHDAQGPSGPQGRGQDARTAEKQEMISYRVTAGKDPLGWEAHLPPDALAGKPLTNRQWLEATAHLEFPDLATGVLSAFDARLNGDIIGYSAPLWDFDGWRKAGHGGIRAAETITVMLLAGPGVPKTRLDTARTVDLMPTLLHLMGRPAPAGLDGGVLINSSSTDANLTANN